MLVMNRPVRVFKKSNNRFVGDPQNFPSSSNVNQKSTLHTVAAESTRECQALISKKAGSGLYQAKVKLKLECDETHT